MKCLYFLVVPDAAAWSFSCGTCPADFSSSFRSKHYFPTGSHVSKKNAVISLLEWWGFSRTDWVFLIAQLWTKIPFFLKQWYDVHQDEQKLRQKHYSATLKHMLKVIESQSNLSEDHLRFIKLLRNGEQPTVVEIMQIKDLFFHGPLSLSKLQIPYVRFDNLLVYPKAGLIYHDFFKI